MALTTEEMSLIEFLRDQMEKLVVDEDKVKAWLLDYILMRHKDDAIVADRDAEPEMAPHPDTVRLDWLESMDSFGMQDSQGGKSVSLTGNGGRFYGRAPDPRGAIDAAMSGSKVSAE